MILATLLTLAAQTAPAAPQAILTITVQKLPATYAKAPIVHLDFDAKGAVSACTLEQTSGSAGIDKVACQQAQTITMPVENGKAPESRSAAIEFVAGAAPAK